MLAIGVSLLLALNLASTAVDQPGVVALNHPAESFRFPDVPLPIDGTWTTFAWSGGPGVFNIDGAFLFPSALGGRLDVTDAFILGDRFEVYDLGSSLGQTSVPVDNGSDVGSDADAAFYNPDCSSGSFVLPAGSHGVTIWVVQTATGYPDGGAYLRFTEGLIFADRFESGLPDRWSEVVGGR